MMYVSLDYGTYYDFHIVYGNDLNGYNHSGCDVVFIWLTAIGFWLQC